MLRVSRRRLCCGNCLTVLVAGILLLLLTVFLGPLGFIVGGLVFAAVVFSGD